MEELPPGIIALREQVKRETERIKNRTKEDVIKELEEEIKQFQEEYNGTFKEIFGHVTDPDALDEPDDYFNWRDALQELKRKQT